MNFIEDNKQLVYELFENSKTLLYKDYEPGEIVIYNGESVNQIGIVMSGLLQIVNYTYAGEKKSHEYLEKNALIPIQPLSGVKEYQFTLLCEKSSKIAWIDKGEFENKVQKSPEILYDMLIHISKKGYRAQVLLGCMKYTKIRERLAYWIVEVNQIESKEYIKLPRTQSILADSLYVNRSSLNQELNKFVDEGLIAIKNRKLTVLAIDKLRENY